MTRQARPALIAKVVGAAALLFRVDPDADTGGSIAETRERRPQRLSSRDRIFSVSTAGAFLLFAAASWYAIDSQRSADPLFVLATVALYALAATIEFEVGGGSAVPTQLVLVPMLFLLPLGLVPACVAAGLLIADIPRYARGHAHPERMALLVMSSWYCAGPVMVLAAAGEQHPQLSHWPLYALALSCQFLFDFAFTTGRNWFAFGIWPGSQVAEMSSVWAVDTALAPVGLFIAMAASEHRYAFLAATPLILLIGLFARERRIRIDSAVELSHAYRGTAFLLGDVVDADDKGTGAHSRDVVSLVVDVAKEMNLDPRLRREAEFAALLHDVGKIRVPKEIINKPAPLTEIEWLVVKQHTVWGEEMLKAVGGLLGEIGTIVRSCHERFDGHGYPDGLAGNQIPLIARIVFACDAFSAMTSDRSYRKARTPAEAIAELQRMAGTQFDPDVSDALARVIAAAEPPTVQTLHLAVA
jgi:HD-GYP domain-containing protein (c-di-GMP phosphodiesterase class II)